jgi:Undecaprenyl-phosphate glucose phosphotransferase
MLKRHSQLFLKLFILNDLIINSLSFILAYYVRFHGQLFPLVSEDIPPLEVYLPFLIYINIIWLFIFKENKLYEPKRGSSRINEFIAIVKSVTIGVIILTGLLFFYRGDSYSRLVVVCFWVINIILLQLSRSLVRSYLSWLRRRGYNLRHVLIIGAGNLGRQIAVKLESRPGLGYKVAGFLDDDRSKQGVEIDGVKVLGTSEDLVKIVSEHGIDEVIIALPLRAHQHMLRLINICQKEGLRVRIVPDLFAVITYQAAIDELDGIPLIGLDKTTMELMGNRFLKRLEDILLATLMLALFSPILLIIAVLIKLTSKGPIFYKQERIGLDNHPFTMYKFRTMKVDAEKESGPVWASENDPRRTPFGAFLRATSLDELPQLFNVLKGEMSLVGPRPERLHFVRQFKEEVARYMQRHHVKAGVTGWAQVNGWRGNTSIEKRIEYDIYYIQNWSLAFDLKIIWLTVWKGLINKNAY